MLLCGTTFPFAHSRACFEGGHGSWPRLPAGCGGDRSHFGGVPPGAGKLGRAGFPVLARWMESVRTGSPKCSAS